MRARIRASRRVTRYNKGADAYDTRVPSQQSFRCGSSARSQSTIFDRASQRVRPMPMAAKMMGSGLIRHPTRNSSDDLAPGVSLLHRCAQQLREALVPLDHLSITDCSDGHTKAGYLDGRALHADGREVKILAVGTIFSGKTPIERHHLVNEVMSPYLHKGTVHSMTLRCWSPGQWETKGKPQTFGEPSVSSSLPCSLAASPVSIMENAAPTVPLGLLPLCLPPSAVDVAPRKHENKACGGDPNLCDGSCQAALF